MISHPDPHDVGPAAPITQAGPTPSGGRGSTPSLPRPPGPACPTCRDGEQQWWLERNSGPAVRRPCPDCGSTRTPLSPADQRLISVLLMLETGIPAVIDQLTAGELPDDQRHMLAVQLQHIAADLWPHDEG